MNEIIWAILPVSLAAIAGWTGVRHYRKEHKPLPPLEVDTPKRRA